MGKKVRDFNKVKLKLGRTLKRQRETVIDLSKKKILLPREKICVDYSIRREPSIVIYEHMKKLQVSSETFQLSALSCIQSILSPYVAQIKADWKAQPLVCYNEKSVESLNNLFGSDYSQNDVALQFGDLLQSLDRLSRHSTSVKLPLETARLCSMIATIFSVHPRIHCALTCLDNIALSLMHRPEFWYRNAGVKILGDLADSRHRVITSLACSAHVSVPFPWFDSLCEFIDANNHSIRKSIYARLLIRHFGSLHENVAFDTISSRKTLLMSTMKYLRDIQYTTFMTPVVSMHSSSCIKLHPFLSPVQLCLPLEETSQPAAPTDAGLRSVWMLFSSNPIFDKLSKASVIKQAKNTAKGRPLSLENSLLSKIEEDSLLEWTLISCVLREGHRLLDELVHSPDTETAFGIVFTTRCLRAFLEMNSPFASFPNSSALPDVGKSLVQFTEHLCELIPPDSAGDTLVPENKSAVSNVGDGAHLSRKRLKRASKRAAKLVRRQNAADLRRGDDVLVKRSKDPVVADRLGRSEILAHLLKQHTLQLVWSLAADGALGQTSMKDFSRSLAVFLLATKVMEGDEDSLPPLNFLHLVSPALSWRWIHCLDFCLLYNLRIRRLSLGSVSLACFVAPVIVALGYIVHRWCRRQQSSTSCRLPNAVIPRVPRLVVRSAGLLVTFLHHELREQLWSGRASFFSPQTASASIETPQSHFLQYDSEWIRATLKDLKVDSPFPGSEDLFSILTTDLCNLVEAESFKPDGCKARWVWAAACLSSLAEIKYVKVQERLERSSVLSEAVRLLKGWTSRTEALDDPLVYLPCPETGNYLSVKSWKCLSVERIYSQDTTSS